MTPLRRQIRSAAHAYRTVRYPGDLAPEVLSHARSPSSGATWRTTFSVIGAFITAAAAVILLALFLRPAGSPTPPSIAGTDANSRLLAALPSGPATTLPVPAVHVPSFPRRVPEPLPQGLDVETYRMHYDDLATQVRPIAPAFRQLTVPKLSDLPDKGFDWLQKVWTADESA